MVLKTPSLATTPMPVFADRVVQQHCVVHLPQVKKEYKDKYWDKIDRDLAVQLGCLDIR